MVVRLKLKSRSLAEGLGASLALLVVLALFFTASFVYVKVMADTRSECRWCIATVAYAQEMPTSTLGYIPNTITANDTATAFQFAPKPKPPKKQKADKTQDTAEPVVYWFQTNNGDTTCRAYTVQPSPFRFSYYCANARGATAGSYTAVGTTTTDVFTIGLAGSTPGSAQSICMVAVNTTPTAALIGSFGSVPANSVAYQCGASTMGTVTIQ